MNCASLDRRGARPALMASLITWAACLLAPGPGHATTITYERDARSKISSDGTVFSPPADFDPWPGGVPSSFEPTAFEGRAMTWVYSSDGVGSGTSTENFAIEFSVDRFVEAAVEVVLSTYYEQPSVSLRSRVGVGHPWQDVISLCASSFFGNDCVQVDEFEAYTETFLVQLQPGLFYAATASASASGWALGTSSDARIAVRLVPEPATATFIGLGLLGLGALRRSRIDLGSRAGPSA